MGHDQGEDVWPLSKVNASLPSIFEDLVIILPAFFIWIEAFFA